MDNSDKYIINIDEHVRSNKDVESDSIEKKFVLKSVSRIKIAQKNFKKIGKDRRKFWTQLKTNINNSFLESMAKDCFHDCFICTKENIKTLIFFDLPDLVEIIKIILKK